MPSVKKTTERLKFRLDDAADLRSSRDIDISGVESVCLTLGPYRNLTTLTAAVLFLHPNCQVLNHAGGRIYGNKKVDFLGTYDREKFDRFIQFTIKISATGQLGQRGGSITRSHAFAAKHKVKETYEATGAQLVKEQITCLFWKESLRTSNAIRDRNVDLADYFAHDTRIRFLLPIRNPMDCAVSNLKTDHKYLFHDLKENPSTADMTRAILDEIFWFAGLQREYPDRFFHFFEHQVSRELLVELADFLQLSRDETWIENALATLEIKSGYDHDASLVDAYRGYVGEKGAPFPELSEGLLAFVAE